MSFINELLTNSQYSTWEPVDLSKRISNTPWNTRWVRESYHRLMYMDRPGIMMNKVVRQEISAKEASECLKTLNVAHFIFQTSKKQEWHFSDDVVRSVSVSFSDYKNFIANRVINQLNGKPKNNPDLSLYQDLLKYFKTIDLPPADIQKICANKAAVELDRELTQKEFDAFASSTDLGKSFFDCFVDRKNHPLFADNVKGVWQPDLLSLGTSPDPHLIGFCDEELAEGNPELGKPYMSKRLCKETKEDILEGLKALGIPYMYLKDDGFEGSDSWITPLKVFIKPSDFSAYIEKNINITYAPKEEKELTDALVKSIEESFPSNADGIISSSVWLYCFWRAISVEINRPLQEGEQSRPAKSWAGRALTRLQDELSNIDNELFGLGVVLGQIDEQDPLLDTERAKNAHGSVIHFAQQEAEKLNQKRGEIEKELARLRD